MTLGYAKRYMKVELDTFAVPTKSGGELTVVSVTKDGKIVWENTLEAFLTMLNADNEDYE